MNLLQADRAVLGHGFARFDGRADRSECWWWLLTWYLVSDAAGALAVLVDPWFLALFGVVFVVGLVPTAAVGARRLHDTGRSGWWQLLVLAPGVGGLVLLWMLAQPGAHQSSDQRSSGTEKAVASRS